ncbi:MAG: phosphoglycerate dehydrogenase [Candidatus Moranbacteria bacterium]|nr:phosphoglycerate dehydrogenase [Candidatus Moranbacteria bacterium]
MPKNQKLSDKKVLIAELTSDEAKEIFAQNQIKCDIKYKLPRKKLLEIIADYNAIIVRSETKIDQELLDKAKKLEVVGRGGSGVDNIDIDYAEKKGVVVANTPRANIISAAEHTVGMILASCRNMAWASSFIKAGNWDRKRFKGSEVYGKILGIIGLGKIGGLVAERIKAFGMKIIAYDPYIKQQRFKRYHAQPMQKLEQLLKLADIITIHTPRTQETTNMIAEKEIKMMKSGVRLVNVARGGLFNEQALFQGMKQGKIASVGIDVWEKEPQKDHDLYEFNTVLGTPHLGASTFEAQARVATQVAEQIIEVFHGNKLPKYALNKVSFKK